MGWGTKSLLSFSLLLTAVHSGYALGEQCFSKGEVEELSQSFTQLKPFLGTRDEVCNSELGDQWTKVIESLLDLKKLNLTKETPYHTKDDFSFKAISDGGWWDYFTNRANQFVLHGSMCRTGAVAYVHPFFEGVIHLCPPYYEQDRIGRAEVLLHEVRHFDGHGHVTCSRGPDMGIQGACDTALEEKGSYAVSMQANLAMGLRGQNFSEAERALGRASALYLLHARFNKETDVKIRESLYLENEQGEIFEWDPDSPAQPRFITKLKSPAKFYTSSLDTILYPLDQTPAYRMTEDFTYPAHALGMFADAYNKVSTDERRNFKAHNYGEKGGYLSHEGYTSLCQREISVVKNSNLPEQMINIFNLDENGEYAGVLVGASGRLYSPECERTGHMKITPLDSYVSRNIYRVVRLRDNRIALSDSGGLFTVVHQGNQFSLHEEIKISELKQNWIEIALRSMPYLFDEVRTKDHMF